jgi:hypothetical protein
MPARAHVITSNPDVQPGISGMYTYGPMDGGPNSNNYPDYCDYLVTATLAPGEVCKTNSKYYAEYYDSGGNYISRSPSTRTAVGATGNYTLNASGTVHVRYEDFDYALTWDFEPANTAYIVYGYYVTATIYDASNQPIAGTVLPPTTGLKRDVYGYWLGSASFSQAPY